MATGDPTLAGFQTFITDVMQVPSDALDPATAPVVVWAYDFAQNWVYQGLQCIPNPGGAWSLYALAVYNLAADTLINWAQDATDAPVYQDGMKFWAWLRGKYEVNDFVAGVVQSTGDQGTNSSYLVPDGFKALTIANLGNLKTPFGRCYLGIAQSWGGIWGLS